MITLPWLQSVRTRLLTSARQGSRSRRNAARPAAHSIDRLEERTLLTVVSFVDGTSLTVQADGGESIVVQHDFTTGNVHVLANNVHATVVPGIASSALESLTIVTGRGCSPERSDGCFQMTAKGRKRIAELSSSAVHSWV